MAIKTSLVPNLPPELRPLFLYLQRRDVGAPNQGLAALELEQTTVGILELDRIAWEYSPPPNQGPERQDPDGFVVWWEDGVTGDPKDGGVRVSASSRQFSMLWPSGELRSYAVAAFRNTHQGEELTSQVQHVTWLGAV